MSSIFDCAHESILPSGECELCGLCIGGSSNATFVDLTSGGEGYSTTVPVKQPTFLAELLRLDIPDEVRTQAILLSESTKQEIHRMGVRKQLLFNYVFLAYLELKINVDPNELATKIKISPTDLAQAIRIISGSSSTKISIPRVRGEALIAPVVVISPLMYIEDLCKTFGISNNKKITTFSQELLKRDRSNILLSKKPVQVAKLLIRNYLHLSGLECPKELCSDISPNIIKKLQAVIQTLLSEK